MTAAWQCAFCRYAIVESSAAALSAFPSLSGVVASYATPLASLPSPMNVLVSAAEAAEPVPERPRPLATDEGTHLRDYLADADR